MSESNKETVRTAPPPPPDNASLPSRIPAAPIRRLPPNLTALPATPTPTTTPPARAISSVPRPLPKPPETNLGLRQDPASGDAALAQSGPKKETARVGLVPRPLASSSPPLNPRQSAPLPIRRVNPASSIPPPFSWVLFGLAALIFLIQIFNYVVS